jgi:hypothetical protein
MARIIPWSFSSWSAYQTCPRQYYELRIAKSIVEPPSKQIIWGNEVHKALENLVKVNKPVPDSMKHMVPIVDRVLAAPGENHAEMELACTSDLKPTGFWESNAWVRGKGDLVKINGTKAAAFDYKTGKRKPNSLQLDLMAILVFAKVPQVKSLSTCFLWFQEPSRPTIAAYRRDDVPKLLDQFTQGVADMEWSMKENVWPAKPSGLCRPNPRTGFPGCPVVSCPHNGRKK